MTRHNPGILKLDHVNVRTAQLDQMIEWYSSVLGLRHGDRPEFSFPGAWLYAGDTAVVHLVGTDGAPGAGAEVELKLEHFALTAASCTALENSLMKTNTQYHRVDAIAMGIVQFNVWDPDGNHIHIDCPIGS